jgi:thiol-disulfide isomerase/thioredoxin
VIDEDAGKSMFSGKGEEANSYLKDRLFPKAGSFLCAGQYAYHTLDSLRDYVNEESSRRLKKLNNLKGVSTSFKELETARIKADIINSYLSFPSYYKPFWKMRKNGLAENDLEKLSNELIAPAIPEIQKLFKEINQDRFLDVEVVRDVFGSVLDKPEIKGNIVYSNRATELFATIEKSSVLSDNPTKENIEDIKAYANTMKSADFKQELLKKVASVGHLLKGFKAFDIQLEDINGKKYQLSDFKGKYLYVDFWATWCGPCNYESPFFEKLNKEINSSQILFVSVSTDTSEQAWKEYLKKNNRDGLQFRTKDNSIYKNWMINGIPRFLLIDKDFNIINAFADRPSTAEAKAALLKLLDK